MSCLIVLSLIYELFDCTQPYELFDCTQLYELFDCTQLYELFDFAQLYELFDFTHVPWLFDYTGSGCFGGDIYHKSVQPIPAAHFVGCAQLHSVFCPPGMHVHWHITSLIPFYFNFGSNLIISALVEAYSLVAGLSL